MWSEGEDAWDDAGSAEDEAHDAGPSVIADPEVWMDAWSEELLNAWYSLRDVAATQGILDACSFPDFAQFCFRHSSGYPPPGFT